MKGLGIALLVIGLLTLTYGALVDHRDRAIRGMDPLEIGAEGKNGVPIQSLFGGMALIGGVSLVITGNRRPWRR